MSYELTAFPHQGDCLPGIPTGAMPVAKVYNP